MGGVAVSWGFVFDGHLMGDVVGSCFRSGMGWLLV